MINSVINNKKETKRRSRGGVSLLWPLPQSVMGQLGCLGQRVRPGWLGTTITCRMELGLLVFNSWLSVILTANSMSQGEGCSSMWNTQSSYIPATPNLHHLTPWCACWSQIHHLVLSPGPGREVLLSEAGSQRLLIAQGLSDGSCGSQERLQSRWEASSVSQPQDLGWLPTAPGMTRV